LKLEDVTTVFKETNRIPIMEIAYTFFISIPILIY
jgi:hypothetical protein